MPVSSLYWKEMHKLQRQYLFSATFSMRVLYTDPGVYVYECKFDCMFLRVCVCVCVCVQVMV